MLENDQTISLDSQPQIITQNSQIRQTSSVQLIPPQQDRNLLQSIQNYLEQHCCIKFLLFLMIILLIVAIYQEEGYLIKKQRTFNFFIDKIQKEKIKKQLISQNQNTPQATPTNKPDSTPNIPTPQLPSARPSTSSTQQKYSSSEGISIEKIVNALRWRNLNNDNSISQLQLAKQEQKYFQQKYKISKYEQLPFCIVVPTFNNVETNRHISNIRSIVMQNYQNYHIVVIDDASTDATGQQIKDYLESQTKVKPSNFTVIVNKQNQGSARNIRYAAFEKCKPDEILIIVDGDDQLIGRQVLKLLNAVYRETGAWIVYSNFISEQGRVGYSKPYPKRVVEGNLYRKYPFVASHLRSLYTQLLRGIKQQDLKDEDGVYFSTANDVAFMLPSLEMAHRRVLYLPQVTYLYNTKTGLNNHQLKLTLQKRNERMIRNKKSYEALAILNNGTKGEDKLFDGQKEVQWMKEIVKIQEGTLDLGEVSNHIGRNA